MTCLFISMESCFAKEINWRIRISIEMGNIIKIWLILLHILFRSKACWMEINIKMLQASKTSFLHRLINLGTVHELWSFLGIVTIVSLILVWVTFLRIWFVSVFIPWARRWTIQLIPIFHLRSINLICIQNNIKMILELKVYLRFLDLVVNRS